MYAHAHQKWYDHREIEVNGLFLRYFLTIARTQSTSKNENNVQDQTFQDREQIAALQKPDVEL